MSDELMQMIKGYGVLRYRMGCSTVSTSEGIAKESALLLNNIQDHIATLEASVAANQKDVRAEIRYNFLVNLLIDRGVLKNKRYSNGTWSLQGIYGVDDSGLRGAGLSPEQAIDNAIVMSRIIPNTKEWDKKWTETFDAIRSGIATDTSTQEKS